jgi:hypothetical protein
MILGIILIVIGANWDFFIKCIALGILGALSLVLILWIIKTIRKFYQIIHIDWN